MDIRPKVRELTCTKSRGGFMLGKTYCVLMSLMTDKRIQVFKSTEHHSQKTPVTHFCCSPNELSDYFNIEQSEIQSITHKINHYLTPKAVLTDYLT